jgi:metal-dependent amidase/aminoacylase/carboxypeptidase family protein
LKHGYPSIINDKAAVNLALNSMKKIFAHDKIKNENMGLAGEDFSYFSRIKPSCFFLLGSALEGNFVKLIERNF